jgi:hypothetical protein
LYINIISVQPLKPYKDIRYPDCLGILFNPHLSIEEREEEVVFVFNELESFFIADAVGTDRRM